MSGTKISVAVASIRFQYQFDFYPLPQVCNSSFVTPVC